MFSRFWNWLLGTADYRTGRSLYYDNRDYPILGPRAMRRGWGDAWTEDHGSR